MQWCGDSPSIEAVNKIVDAAQQLRPQMSLLQERPNGTLRQYTLLAEFWNDEQGVIVRVDEMTAKAVTLICAGRVKVFRRFGSREGAKRTEKGAK
jgi:hypothetical protein